MLHAAHCGSGSFKADRLLQPLEGLKGESWLHIRGCACRHPLNSFACAHDTHPVQGRTAPCCKMFLAAFKVAVSFTSGDPQQGRNRWASRHSTYLAASEQTQKAHDEAA